MISNIQGQIQDFWKGGFGCITPEPPPDRPLKLYYKLVPDENAHF